MPGPNLRYEPLERLSIPRAVRRVPFVVERCRGRAVLDLGGYDETALAKRGSAHWLHGEIAKVAARVLGVDGSADIPPGGLETGERSRIVRGDVAALDRALLGDLSFDVIVAGELIEHLADTPAFLARLRALFPGKELVCTTPNATSLTNVLIGLASRESCHPDHLQIYSYKTLHTLALRAGFESFEIRPYHVAYTELALRSGGVKRLVVSAAETLVRAAEAAFPLLSGGWILHVTRI